MDCYLVEIDWLSEAFGAKSRQKFVNFVLSHFMETKLEKKYTFGDCFESNLMITEKELKVETFR